MATLQEVIQSIHAMEQVRLDAIRAVHVSSLLPAMEQAHASLVKALDTSSLFLSRLYMREKDQNVPQIRVARVRFLRGISSASCRK